MSTNPSETDEKNFLINNQIEDESIIEIEEI